MRARELLPTAPPARVWAAVRALLRPHRRLLVATAVAFLGSTLAALVIPRLLGRIVDLVVEERPAGDLTAPVVGLAVAAVVTGLLTLLQITLSARLGETVLAGLRERVMERALGLPLERVERAGSGDLVARVSGDVSVVSEAAQRVLGALVSSALTILLTFGALALLDWRLALAAMLAVPIQAWTLRWYLCRSAPLYARERVAEGERAQRLLDSIEGASTARALGIGPLHLRQVRERSQAALDISLAAATLRTRFWGRLNVAELVGMSAILTTGFLLVRDDAVTVGAATAAALYFHALFDPINVLLILFDDAQMAGAALARLVGVAEVEPPPEPADPPAPRSAAVEALGLRHAYVPGHEVVRGVDLRLDAGERVALIGASGAGKTTLAKLLAGIHTPTAGRILVGGRTLEELGPRASREAVALITQEVHVFAGRLADDLRLVRPKAAGEDLRAALEAVGALEWAEALPEGLETVVGEGGHRLTATQAQQLALARLTLADPPVAILDEATAEAGSAGARALEQAADRALAGRTALVIAHRLTQAVTADRILVLEAGRIVESGTHERLVAAGGPYAALWQAWSQARGNGRGEVPEPAPQAP